MGQQAEPEKFVVDEWVTFYRGEDQRKVQVTDVNEDEVTVRYAGQRLKFKPRPSDGMHVLVGSPDHEVMPDMIYHQKSTTPVKKQSRWKDTLDFLHGMFWGSSR